MDIKQKYAIGIISVLLLIFVIGIILFTSSVYVPDFDGGSNIAQKAEDTTQIGDQLIDVDNVETEPEKDKCAAYTDPTSKVICEDNLIITDVLRSNLLGACSDLQLDENQQYCENLFYKKLAYKNNDAVLCEKITDNILKTQCENDIIYTETVKTGALEGCDNISDPKQQQKCKDKIIYSKAYTEGDVAQCEFLSDSSLKISCVAKVSEKGDEIAFNKAVDNFDSSQCANVSGAKQAECYDTVYFNTGVTENDISACTRISDKELKNNCQDTVNRNLAILEEYAGYCAKIIAAESKSSCIRELDKVFLKLAIREKNADKCNLISDITLKDRCLIAF